MTSGSMSPSAAALTGLTGTSAASHSPNDGRLRAPSAAALADTATLSLIAGVPKPAGIIPNNAGARRAVATAADNSIVAKTTSDRTPIRPRAPALSTEATLTIRRETTSGTTVIRIAFTQSLPTGSTNDAIES